MGQLFHPRFGFYLQLGLLAAVVLVVAGIAVWRTVAAAPGVGRVLEQPVPFSHKHHVGDDWLLLGTAALGTAFLVIHGFEYYGEYTEHLIPGINFDQPGPHAHAMELFFCLYYFITGFHSVHVIVGVLLITTLAARVARGAFSAEQHNTLELAALYWHLVDIVWVFVYPVIYLVGRSG